MTEHQPSPKELIASPLSNEQLLPLGADEQLYDIYTNRIKGMPGFRQRLFAEARDDFVKTIHEADDESDPAYIKAILDMLITPESYQEFRGDLSDYWQKHHIESKLRTHSVCFLTNHRFFSDLPVTAATIKDIRSHDPRAASRNLLIEGKLIPGMELDIFGNGQYTPVTPLIKMIARQVQTVPKLPKDATDAMKAQRLIWNDEAKSVIEKASSVPGHILYESASGTHDEASEDGKKLIMKSVNPETARLLCNPRLIIMPLYFSCDSFGSAGLRPARAKYRLLDPRTVDKEDEVWDIMRELAAAGTELLADEFPRGVEYEATFKDRAHRAGRLFKGRLSFDEDESQGMY